MARRYAENIPGPANAPRDVLRVLYQREKKESNKKTHVRQCHLENPFSADGFQNRLGPDGFQNRLGPDGFAPAVCYRSISLTSPVVLRETRAAWIARCLVSSSLHNPPIDLWPRIVPALRLEMAATCSVACSVCQRRASQCLPRKPRELARDRLMSRDAGSYPRVYLVSWRGSVRCSAWSLSQRRAAHPAQISLSCQYVGVTPTAVSSKTSQPHT